MWYTGAAVICRIAGFWGAWLWLDFIWQVTDAWWEVGRRSFSLAVTVTRGWIEVKRGYWENGGRRRVFGRSV